MCSIKTQCISPYIIAHGRLPTCRGIHCLSPVFCSRVNVKDNINQQKGLKSVRAKRPSWIPTFVYKVMKTDENAFSSGIQHWNKKKLESQRHAGESNEDIGPEWFQAASERDVDMVQHMIGIEEDIRMKNKNGKLYLFQVWKLDMKDCSRCYYSLDCNMRRSGRALGIAAETDMKG